MDMQMEWIWARSRDERDVWLMGLIATKPMKPALTALAVVLAGHVNSDKGFAWPKRKTLCDETGGYSRQALEKVQDEMVEMGYLVVVQNGRAGSNHYYLAFPSQEVADVNWEKVKGRKANHEWQRVPGDALARQEKTRNARSASKKERKSKKGNEGCGNERVSSEENRNARYLNTAMPVADYRIGRCVRTAEVTGQKNKGRALQARAPHTATSEYVAVYEELSSLLPLGERPSEIASLLRRALGEIEQNTLMKRAKIWHAKNKEIAASEIVDDPVTLTEFLEDKYYEKPYWDAYSDE